MEQWIQTYDPLVELFSGSPEYVISALVAAIPLIVLFYLLAVRRTPGHIAALTSTTIALLLAIFAWKMPTSLAINATVMGACFGLFPIVWIVVTAVWVFNMTVESGEFEIVKSSLANLSDDRRLQALFIAFAFGSFLEGTAGFGTPVAITAAMLAGIGFNPLYAAGLCLVANCAPVAFGAIGVPIVAAANASGLDINHISAIAGRQLPLLSVLGPIWISCIMCGFKRSLEIWPAVLVAGLAFAIPQYIFSNFHGPYLPDIMSSIITIIAMITLLRFWQPKKVFRFEDDPAIVTNKVATYSSAELFRAWLPYLVLALLVFLWGLKDVKSVLNSLGTWAIAWPGLHGVIFKTLPIVSKETLYPALFNLNLLSAAGTAIFFAGIISTFIMKGYGASKAFACLFRTFYQLRFPVVTIATILALASIMNYSGMSATLGIVFTRTGHYFPLFAPILGWIGVFLTGSDTSSNALFCGIQRTTADAVGIDPHLTVAANCAGGGTAKMISPQSISVATAATGLIGKEGNLFRFTFFHSVAMTVVVCILSYLQAYALNWMIVYP